MVDFSIDERSIRRIAKLERIYRVDGPAILFKALRNNLWLEGRGFKNRFRGRTAGAFKSGGRRVANAFKVYTAGKDLNSLTLGIFTAWKAAEIYEKGGVITPRGRWLVVPVSPKAYTAAGRVKRSWRGVNANTFNAARFKDLRPIKVRGGVLLVRDRGVTKKGNLGKVTKKRGVEAVEPVFLLIKSTRRRAILKFFSSFEAEASQRGQRMQRGVNRSLTRIARRIEAGNA